MDRFVTKILKTHEINFEKKIYSSHVRIPLILSGLWPDQSHFVRKWLFAINQVVMFSGIVPIMLFLVQDWGNDYDIMIENLACLLFVSACSLCHWIIYVNVDKVEELHFETSEIQRDLANDVERRQFRDFLKFGYLLSFVFTAYLLALLLSISSIPILASLWNIISPPNNGSTSHPVYLHLSYVFFEQQDHYCFNSFHMIALMSALFVLLTGATGAFIINMEQTCGFFLITRLRDIVGIRDGGGLSVGYIRYKNLKDAVELHNEAIRLCDLLEETFHPLALITETGAVIVIALLNVYVLLGNAIVGKKTIMLSISLGIYGFLFVSNFLGQRMIDHSERVLDSIYLSDWYLARPTDRRLLLLIMQRSQRLSELTAGKIATLSMETFAKVLKMSTSYFTALASMKSDK